MGSNAQLNKPTHLRRFGARSTGRLWSERFRSAKMLGVVMVVLGAILLTLISGYYAYSAKARSQLDELNFVVAQPSSQPKIDVASLASSHNGVKPPQDTTTLASGESPAIEQVSLRSSPRADRQNVLANQETAANQNSPVRPHTSYTTLYPGTHIHPKFWAQPLWSGGDPYVYSPSDTGAELPDGFRVVSAMDDALRIGDGALTTRITIPLIDVDSAIQELAILNLGDSRAYETPKHLVGHIPQSPNPGELGNAWYFGHLESPIRGEGNVFHRLPEIPDLLRDGDAVFVELESTDGTVFLYRTTRTEVMHQDDLKLYDSDVAQITLVACVPRLVYDHRILITAELVGIKDPPGAVN